MCPKSCPLTWLIVTHPSVVCLRLQDDKPTFVTLFPTFEYYHAEWYFFKAPRGLFPLIR